MATDREITIPNADDTVRFTDIAGEAVALVDIPWEGAESARDNPRVIVTGETNAALIPGVPVKMRSQFDELRIFNPSTAAAGETAILRIYEKRRDATPFRPLVQSQKARRTPDDVGLSDRDLVRRSADKIITPRDFRRAGDDYRDAVLVEEDFTSDRDLTTRTDADPGPGAIVQREDGYGGAVDISGGTITVPSDAGGLRIDAGGPREIYPGMCAIFEFVNDGTGSEHRFGLLSPSGFTTDAIEIGALGYLEGSFNLYCDGQMVQGARLGPDTPETVRMAFLLREDTVAVFVQGDQFRSVGADIGGDEWYNFAEIDHSYSFDERLVPGALYMGGKDKTEIGEITVRNGLPRSRDHQCLDFERDGVGVHVPSIVPAYEDDLDAVAAWQRGSEHGSGDVRLRMAYSRNGVWSDPVTVQEPAPAGRVVRMGALHRVAGEYRIVYNRHDTGDTSTKRMHYRSVEITDAGEIIASTERPVNGITKSEPAPQGIHNRALTLDGGRIAFGWNRDGTGQLAISDDSGASWRNVQIAGEPFAEPTVVQRADGDLVAFGRDPNGNQRRAFSSDNGDTWSAPEVTDIQGQNGRQTALRIGDKIGVLTHRDDGTGFPRRKNLTLYLLTEAGDAVLRRYSLVKYDSYGGTANYHFHHYPMGIYEDGILTVIYAEAYDGDNIDHPHSAAHVYSRPITP